MTANPYARPDGGPQDGQFTDWLRWEEAREAERRAALTDEERAAEDAQVRRILERRASEGL